MTRAPAPRCVTGPEKTGTFDLPWGGGGSCSPSSTGTAPVSLSDFFRHHLGTGSMLPRLLGTHCQVAPRNEISSVPWWLQAGGRLTRSALGEFRHCPLGFTKVTRQCMGKVPQMVPRHPHEKVIIYCKANFSAYNKAASLAW